VGRKREARQGGRRGEARGWAEEERPGGGAEKMWPAVGLENEKGARRGAGGRSLNGSKGEKGSSGNGGSPSEPRRSRVCIVVDGSCKTRVGGVRCDTRSSPGLHGHQLAVAIEENPFPRRGKEETVQARRPSDASSGQNVEACQGCRGGSPEVSTGLIWRLCVEVRSTNYTFLVDPRLPWWLSSKDQSGFTAKAKGENLQRQAWLA